MSKCEYLRKRCKSGCDNYVCRAFFPEKQPLIMDRDVPMCQSGGEDCVLRIEGRIYQKEKREKKHKIHCPFASNTICGKPWEWWCKGRVPPFPLTLYEKNELGLPKRDSEGEIIYQRGIEEFKETLKARGIKRVIRTPTKKEMKRRSKNL